MNDVMQTRRRFLRDCSLAAATAAFAPAVLAGGSASTPARHTLAHFRDFLNARFIVSDQTFRADLQLVEAVAFPAPPAKPGATGDHNFWLRFCGPTGAALPQNTYEFENPEFGRLAIFIVPGRPTASHQVYEAVFNRPRSAAEMARQLACAPRRGAEG